jgi:hypothetical protein
MAFFSVQDGKCKDAAPSSGLYTTYCENNLIYIYWSASSSRQEQILANFLN